SRLSAPADTSCYSPRSSFFHAPPPPVFSPLSLHDALPILAAYFATSRDSVAAEIPGYTPPRRWRLLGSSAEGGSIGTVTVTSTTHQPPASASGRTRPG